MERPLPASDPAAEPLVQALVELNATISKAASASVIHPVAAELYLRRGDVYFDMGEHAKAVGDYTRALLAAPMSAVAYANRGRAFYILGDYRLAYDDFGHAMGIEGASGPLLFDRGRAALQCGLLAEALAAFDEAARTGCSKMATLYGHRADTHLRLGGRDHALAAIKDYTRALRLAPRAAGYYERRGYARLQTQNADQHAAALEDLDVAVRFGENSVAAAALLHRSLIAADAAAVAGRAVASIDTARVARWLWAAIDDASAALGLADQLPPSASVTSLRGAALMARAKALIELHLYEDAIADCTSAIAVDETVAKTALFHRGTARLALADPAGALRDLGEALMQGDMGTPASRATLINRSRALIELGRHDDALRDCAIVLDEEPESAEAMANCGAAHFAMGDFDKAVDAFARAQHLAHVPEHKEAIASFMHRAVAARRSQSSADVAVG